MNLNEAAVNPLRTTRILHALAQIGAAALMFGAGTARAELLGPYVGGAVGQARVATGEQSVAIPSGTLSAGSFAENHSAFKVMAGVRVLSLVGAEIEYFDFGHPERAFSSSGVIASTDVKMTGAAAFGMLYLLPVPILDLYVKAGVARLQANSNVTGVLPGVGTCPVTAPNCAVFSQRFSATTTSAAGGAGVQLKVGKWAVHAEYERFNAAGANPGLASVGVRWTFL
ncbi:MAG TPA: outer membrane beta-barrel protein [Candidatus Dormibacteraeota bacterium]|nr:outer membrane beta-barrel protein [Candidatus Dormibacteraeota bacterium]